MNQNKYLLLIASLGCLALLVTAAVEENFRKEWRRIQQSARAEAGPVEVRLRQIVVPGLRATDRCTSCHVGMSPGEMGVSGAAVLVAHPPMPHDPAEFGCTVCHGGQGRATEKHDAHGRVAHWPQPMIPTQYVYAGCGSCHTHLQVPSQTALQRGRNLLERYDCLACHKLDGRGGTLRVGGVGGMEGPDLSAVGASGYDPAWYDKHLQKHRAAPLGDVWRTSFGEIAGEHLHDLAVFLSSRVGAPGLVEAKALFHTLGCRGCHKVHGVGGDDGPDLSRVGQKDPGQLDFRQVPGEPTVANWLAEKLRAPGKLTPGSLMPTLGLSEEQIERLVFYLLSLRESEFPEAFWPKDRIRAQRFGEREFATDGATLYGTFCAACHGPHGEGMRYPGMPAFPAVSNPDFLALASDEFLTETIRRGRPGRRMPAWGEREGGLRPEEIRTLVKYLRADVPLEPDTKPARWVSGDVGQGRQLYVANCAGCHGDNGQGAEGPALNNPVLLSSATDTFLVESIARGRRGTSMPGFANPSPTHPTLSREEIEAIVRFIRTWEKPQ